MFCWQTTQYIFHISSFCHSIINFKCRHWNLLRLRQYSLADTLFIIFKLGFISADIFFLLHNMLWYGWLFQQPDRIFFIISLPKVELKSLYSTTIRNWSTFHWNLTEWMEKFIFSEFSARIDPWILWLRSNSYVYLTQTIRVSDGIGKFTFEGFSALWENWYSETTKPV